MEEKKKIPTKRDILSGWAIWCFSGLFFAYWVLGWESSKEVIVAAFGVKVYANMLAVTLVVAIFSSAFGGPKVFKFMLQIQQIIKQIKFPEEENETN